MTFESAPLLLREVEKGKPAASNIDASEFWMPPVISTGVNDRQIPIAVAQRFSLFQSLEAQSNKPSPLEHKLIFQENATEAYHTAFASQKPLVAVFTQSGGQYSQQLLHEMNSLQLGGVAGQAVFVTPDPERDLVALGMAKRLGITKFPTISVLDTSDPNRLNEVARIEGYVAPKPLKESLVSCIESAAGPDGKITNLHSTLV